MKIDFTDAELETIAAAMDDYIAVSYTHLRAHET